MIFGGSEVSSITIKSLFNNTDYMLVGFLLFRFVCVHVSLRVCQKIDLNLSQHPILGHLFL